MSKAEARLVADQLLRGMGVSEAPVKIRKLVRAQGISISEEKLERKVSSILFQGKEPRITLNRRHSRERQRFALAHALGHFLLHSKGGAAVFVTDLGIHIRSGDPERSDPRELEANAFALELLLPENLLRTSIREEEVDLSDSVGVDSLAAKFGVTPSLLVLRIARLGLVWGV